MNQDKLFEYKQRVAFHEAGHAAGIHLNNKDRRLPPVFLKILFKELSGETEKDVLSYQELQDQYIAQVEGGRLIELFPDGLMLKLTEHNDKMVQLIQDYRIAFESDIINLLIGSLAEAKHIADTDNEPFNLKLINLKALKNYGGNSGLAMVNEYFKSFFADKHKDEKLDELFTKAYDFVNNDLNWAAITKLAKYILDGSNNIIYYDEISLILDRSMANFIDRRTKERHRNNEWFKKTAQHLKVSYAQRIEHVKRPSRAELDSMSHAEKDMLILKLFDLLDRP
jgi:hypothetical protein